MLVSFMCILLSVFFEINVSADKSEKVKVGFFTDRPYFMEGSEDGVKSGYAYDYLQTISNYTGWEYEYVFGTHAELMEMFLNNEIDIFPAIPKNEAYEDKMLYTEYPVGSMICRLYTLNTNKDITYGNQQSFNNITIGLTKNNVLYDMFAERLESESINCKLVKFDSYEEKNAEFEKGTVDAVIDFEAMAKDNWMPVKMLGSYDYYLAVSNNRADLIDDVNNALSILYDRSPYYNNLLYYQNYSKDGSIRAVTDEELQWISDNNQMKIGIINKYPTMTNSGRVNAFIKTVISKILEQVSDGKVKPVYIEYNSHQTLLYALDNGEIDVAYPLFDDSNIAEDNGYSVVGSLEKTPMDIITLNHMDFDEIHTIVANDEMSFLFAKVNFPDAEIVCMNSRAECFDAINEKIADAAVMPCHLTLTDFEDVDNFDKLIFTEYKSMGSALAVKKNNTALYSLMDRGVNSIDEEYLIHISTATTTDEGYDIDDFFYEYYWIINTVLAVVLVLVLVVAVLIWLRKRNKKRHKEATIYQCALYSQAVGYFRCNLSKDNMLTPYMKMIDGEPVDVIDYMPATIDTPFSSLMDYIASHFVVDDPSSFRKFMNPDKFIEGFEEGNFKPEFSCWVTVPTDGRKIFQRFSYFLSKENSGDIVATCILYDNSEHEGELQQQRIKAEAANIAKSTFLFNMSHDVRTPMNAIIGYANMAEKNIGDKEKISDYVNKIQYSSKRLLRLLDDALDMSRAESGKILVKETDFDIHEYIEGIIEKTERKTKKCGLMFSYNIDEISNIKISTDIMHLDKIFFNIIDNAIKYNKDGGNLRIEAFERDSVRLGYKNYEFVVSDTGIGMSNEFLKQVFEMFARENTSTISGIHGTGVGMAITKRLVDLLGGNIYVESKKNVGTTFKISFDFRIHTEYAKIQQNEKQEISFKDKRILLVEDIDLNREIAREILEEEGIIVDEAVDGCVAVNMVKNSEPGYYDLVFMDIQMPIMDGYEATRKIRKLENSALASIPIVAMTANALDEDIQNCLEAGMNEHLPKPIDVVKMFKTISKYIN